jgi:hypothetical protein
MTYQLIVFKVLIRAAPKRKDLLKTLAYGEEGMEDQVFIM